jgi:hypothetical protein
MGQFIGIATLVFKSKGSLCPDATELRAGRLTPAPDYHY